jgi:hypothetical protein
VVTKDGIKPDMKKVKAIQEWKRPSTQKGLRSFLGLANYYRRFIRDFSKVARPLSDLLKKGVSQEWDEPYNQAKSLSGAQEQIVFAARAKVLGV